MSLDFYFWLGAEAEGLTSVTEEEFFERVEREEERERKFREVEIETDCTGWGVSLQEV